MLNKHSMALESTGTCCKSRRVFPSKKAKTSFASSSDQWAHNNGINCHGGDISGWGWLRWESVPAAGLCGLLLSLLGHNVYSEQIVPCSASCVSMEVAGAVSGACSVRFVRDLSVFSGHPHANCLDRCRVLTGIFFWKSCTPTPPLWWVHEAQFSLVFGRKPHLTTFVLVYLKLITFSKHLKG